VFVSSHGLSPDIVCFLSQWDFGTVDQAYRQVPPYRDTKENRLHWCRQCLDEPATVNIKSIGITHNVGCGLGGGDWADYISSISDFAKKTDIYIAIFIP
jgi:hypothetical protein